MLQGASRIKRYPNQSTQRVILSIVNSFYDPLGFWAPAIQPMKVLLHDLCRKKLDWDQEIPHESERLWMEWFQQLPLLAFFQLPRCYKPNTFGNVVKAQLHFSDASERSFGYISYLRLVNDNNQSHCALLMGKTKLTPLKPLTTLRLEFAQPPFLLGLITFFGKNSTYPTNCSHRYFGRIVLPYSVISTMKLKSSILSYLIAFRRFEIRPNHRNGAT